MFHLETLLDVFVKLAASGREHAFLYQDADDAWQPLSSADIAARVYSLASAFTRWGVGKGDRVAILGENRWEWPVADFATLALGAADVPIYPTLTPEQTAALIRDSGARIAVVSSARQYAKVASLRGQTSLERIVAMDSLPPEELDSAAGDLCLESLPAFAEREPVSPAAAAWLEGLRANPPVTPDDLATLIYTSGTTGEPKGVMLTHGNIASNLNHSTAEFPWDESCVSISFLPLSHITARHLDYALMCYGATLAYCPRLEALPGALAAVRPTVFVAVPRVYEKIRERAEVLAGRKPLTSKVFAWAFATGRRHRAAVLAGRRPLSPAWRLADRLVFRKIRQPFGGHVEDFIAGGAPLGVDTASWFADAGIRIYEGYGLTETSPVLALNNSRDHRIGSVGKPIQTVEHRIASDGELLVRGPFLFRGYWGKPQETREAIDEEGWFHTGDLGSLDEDGFLYITGRKKEMLKTSGGKMVAPQPIENSLKACPLVSQAAVFGDRQKFIGVLLAPDFSALEAWAAQQGIAFTDRASLLRDPRVVTRYQAVVDGVNGSLARFETLKRFYLAPDEWSIEGGELTPSLKLKRNVVLERYQAEIAALYPGVDTQPTKSPLSS